MTSKTNPSAANRSQLQTGMIMLVCAMLILPGIDAIAKGLSDTIAPGQIAWSRFFFQIIILLPFVIRDGGLWVGRKIWAHAARGFLIGIATLMFFASLAKLPLADAISIFFVEPFILTLLSAVVLGEKVGWRRLAAISVGFCGALIIIRPSYEVFGLTALLPMGAALAFSVYIILSRSLVREGSAITMQFYAGIFGCLTLSLALFFGGGAGIAVLTPVWPTLTEWALLFALGCIATGGHMLIMLAIRRIDAGLIAPFQYLEIISSVILGLVFFGDFPDTMTWVGIAIIIASGLYVFYRERKIAVQV
ncbi:MAG: DMT family transporter [Rhodospirillales bacterium]|nr:DMT family transporter [Rhodospirillales bacterium]